MHNKSRNIQIKKELFDFMLSSCKFKPINFPDVATTVSFFVSRTVVMVSAVAQLC